MKRWVMILLCVGGLWAQGELTLTAGANLAWIRFNDYEVRDEVEVSPRLGGMAGLEGIIGPYRVGISYIQRGSLLGNVPDDIDEAEHLYNYLSFHVIRLLPVQESPVPTIGLQLGVCLGGKESAGHTHQLGGEDFQFDYGLLLGLENKFSERAGVRIAYYHGLGDVAKDVPARLNWKNRGVGATLLYTLPEPKRRPFP